MDAGPSGSGLERLAELRRVGRLTPPGGDDRMPGGWSDSDETRYHQALLAVVLPEHAETVTFADGKHDRGDAAAVQPAAHLSPTEPACLMIARRWCRGLCLLGGHPQANSVVPGSLTCAVNKKGVGAGGPRP